MKLELLLVPVANYENRFAAVNPKYITAIEDEGNGEYKVYVVDCGAINVKWEKGLQSLIEHFQSKL